MIKEAVKWAGKKLLGDNVLFKETAYTYKAKGRYFTAAAFTLCTAPFRKAVDYRRVLKQYEFITSEDYYRELHGLLRIDAAEGFGLVRIGRDNDGGYIMLDDLPGGVAYSFGIAGDVSWDKDMASRGYDVFMYDHTIDGLPEENPRFHWHKLGISDGLTQDDRLKSLEELITANGHEGQRNMILKMDVEGAEWGFLERVRPETLAQFGQIVFEFHSMTNPDNTERILNALRKINATHQLIHLHANNNSTYITSGGKNFASVLEASYVLRDKYRFSASYDLTLPLEIDSPNAPGYPEIPLGHWNSQPEFDGKFTLSCIEEKILRQ